jgi:hypothetical protein
MVRNSVGGIHPRMSDANQNFAWLHDRGWPLADCENGTGRTI